MRGPPRRRRVTMPRSAEREAGWRTASDTNPRYLLVSELFEKSRLLGRKVRVLTAETCATPDRPPGGQSLWSRNWAPRALGRSILAGPQPHRILAGRTFLGRPGRRLSQRTTPSSSPSVGLAAKPALALARIDLGRVIKPVPTENPVWKKNLEKRANHVTISIHGRYRGSPSWDTAGIAQVASQAVGREPRPSAPT